MHVSFSQYEGLDRGILACYSLHSCVAAPCLPLLKSPPSHQRDSHTEVAEWGSAAAVAVVVVVAADAVVVVSENAGARAARAAEYTHCR